MLDFELKNIIVHIVITFDAKVYEIVDCCALQFAYKILYIEVCGPSPTKKLRQYYFDTEIMRKLQRITNFDVVLLKSQTLVTVRLFQ